MKLISLALIIMLGFSSVTKAECNLADARSGKSQVPVFVVTTTPEGFTQLKQVADSTKDFIKALKDKKGLCITDKRTEALVILEVLGRGKAQMTNTWFGPGRDVTVAVKLNAGKFETTIEESAAGGTVMAGGAWKKAAGKIAKRVEQWVQENREKLMKMEDNHTEEKSEDP
jgi:hypothetical protein